jgi:hypothetical protein
LDFEVFWSHMYKVTITNIKSIRLGFIGKLRPKRFHKIDPRSPTCSRLHCKNLASYSMGTKMRSVCGMYNIWLDIKC